MQITPAPPLPPIASAVTEPQTLTTGLPQVLTQAVAPITQKAVAPAPKSERGKKSHRQGDTEREEEKHADAKNRGDHVNLSV